MDLANDLEQAISEYAVPLRMREGLSRAAERELHLRLAELRVALGDTATIDRGLATMLAELFVASWACTSAYASAEREAIELSLASIGEAIMSVLTPDEMPPVPSELGRPSA